jgi:hypothetical protein
MLLSRVVFNAALVLAGSSSPDATVKVITKDAIIRINGDRVPRPKPGGLFG